MSSYQEYGSTGTTGNTSTTSTISTHVNTNQNTSTQPQIFINQEIYQNWSPENVKTVTKWKESSNIALFVCKYVLDKYKYRLKIFNILCFLLSTGITIISTYTTSTSSTSLVSNTTKLVTQLLLVTTIFNGVNIFISGCLTMLSWQSSVEELTKYSSKLESFNSRLNITLSITPKEREDAATFIKHNKELLDELTKNPYITIKDTTEGYNKYVEYKKLPIFNHQLNEDSPINII